MYRNTAVLYCLFGTCCFCTGTLLAQLPEIDKLVSKLGSRNADERAAAASAIGKLDKVDKAAGRALCQAMLDPSLKVQTESRSAMKTLFPELYPHLDLLASGSDTALEHNIIMRMKARNKIGNFGRDGSVAFPLLLSRIKINLSAIASVPLKIGRPFMMHTEELAVILDIETILKIAPEDTQTINLLIAIATSGASTVKITLMAVKELEQTAKNQKDKQKLIIPALKTLVGHPHSTVKSAALTAIKRLEVE